MKRVSAVFLALLCALLVGCTGKHTLKKTEITAAISEDVKFHSATVALSREQMEEAGFKLGDSCDLSFSNGLSLNDVPFYNGYYVKNGEPVLVAYPGYDTVTVTYNNMGIWSQGGFREGDTVTVSLNTAGKYSDVQEILGQNYSFDRTEYGSDEAFCNFRVMSGGKLKKDTFFRGASPVDNSRGRACYADKLLKESGIRFIIDLADSDENIADYFLAADFSSPYSSELFFNGRVAALNMSSSYASEEYKKKVAEGFREMLTADGPVYIHCMEGKDRTGFVCLVLEALAGADYDELQSDYMMTYSNYYSVTADGTPEKYKAISELYFVPFIEYLHGSSEPLKDGETYAPDAAAYLREGGLTDQEIRLLTDFITE